jgi:hypothetical protein
LNAADQTGQRPALVIKSLDAVPWDGPPRGFNVRAKTKTVMKTPEHGRVVYYYFPPTWDTVLHPAGSPGNPARTHYHTHHEWGYVLSGDYILNEAVSPFQRNPAVYRYVEGTWLSRPAQSLHSGDWATGGLRSQNPSGMILLEEGDTTVTLLADGKLETRSSDTKEVSVRDGNPDELRKMSFASPWLVDSGSAMEWETDTQTKGRMVKWLSEDPQQGFRAQLIKIPPGWTPPQGETKSYFKNAHRIRYVLYGDLNVWSFDNENASGKPEKVGRDYFIYQPAQSIWGFGPGPVTENGAVWLEVTYAKGLSVGGGPIEEPTYIR